MARSSPFSSLLGLPSMCLQPLLLPPSSPTHTYTTGVSFSFTPLKGPSAASPSFLTPSKVLLANGETRMNMLSPGDATKLFHADVEYGKVVSEWRFNKDEVDIPQVGMWSGVCVC